MKSNDPAIQHQHLNLTNENTFIVNVGSDFRTVISAHIPLLQATGKTVIITDPYLFPTNGDDAYFQELTQLLKDLQCTRIIYVNRPKKPDKFSQMVTDLSAAGIVLDNICTTTSIHDRYWICLESQKGFITGTSPNGMSGKLSHINELPADDVKTLIDLYKAESVITD